MPKRVMKISRYWQPSCQNFCISSLLIASLLIACNPSARHDDGHPNTFVVALDSAPSQLDPRFATDAYSERIGHLLFSALIRIGPHEEIIPDLASRWEIQDHQMTFFLKKNVRFHDGRPLTSEDVRYTYESILNPETASPFRALYEVIEAIETPNSETVRFILKRPNAPFLSTLTRGILPKPAQRKNGLEVKETTLIGSGPFLFIAYEPDDAVALAPFSNYFEGAPSPSIRRLLFRIIPDESTRLLELEKGNIDLIQNGFSPDVLPRLQKNPRLRIATRPSTTYSYIGFNLTDPMLKKRVVREAIARAIDKEAMIRYLLGGQAAPANSLLTDRHWAYTPTKRHTYDPSYASRLLDQAQLYRNPKSGERFHLIYKTSQNELGRRMAEVIQGYLAQVGIAVTLRSFEWGTFYADIKSGNFQIFSLSWVGVNDPDIYYDLFHSQAIPPNGSNRVRYQNQRIDDLLLLGRIILPQDQRKTVYKEIQEILSEDLPYVSLWHAGNIAVMKKEVMGYTVYENGDFYSLKDVSRAPQRQAPQARGGNSSLRSPESVDTWPSVA